MTRLPSSTGTADFTMADGGSVAGGATDAVTVRAPKALAGSASRQPTVIIPPVSPGTARNLLRLSACGAFEAGMIRKLSGFAVREPA